jgi:hypothetical protein
VEKYCIARQATDENMALALCMLDTLVYKHTFRICNTYCFYTAIMFAGICLSVTLYVHCLSCLLLDVQLHLYYFLFHISDVCGLMMAALVEPKHVAV